MKSQTAWGGQSATRSRKEFTVLSRVQCEAVWVLALGRRPAHLLHYFFFSSLTYKFVFFQKANQDSTV